MDSMGLIYCPVNVIKKLTKLTNIKLVVPGFLYFGKDFSEETHQTFQRLKTVCRLKIQSFVFLPSLFSLCTTSCSHRAVNILWSGSNMDFVSSFDLRLY